MSADEPRKKRRQNVACDSCKLRRIKCDLLELLTSLPSSSASSSTSDPNEKPPLNLLVQQYPHVHCTNCNSKGLRCTANQITNPSKPNKGGKRIDEAKRTFGSESERQAESDGDFLARQQASGSASTQNITPVSNDAINVAGDTSQGGYNRGDWADYDILGPNSLPTHEIDFNVNTDEQHIFDTLLASFTEHSPHPSLPWPEQPVMPESSPLPPPMQTYKYEPNFPRLVQLDRHNGTPPLISTTCEKEKSPAARKQSNKSAGGEPDVAEVDQAADIWWRFANDPQDVMKLAKQKGSRLDLTPAEIRLAVEVPPAKLYDRLADTLQAIAQSETSVNPHSAYADSSSNSARPPSRQPASSSPSTLSRRSPTPNTGTPRSHASSNESSYSVGKTLKRPRSTSMAPMEGEIEALREDMWRLWVGGNAVIRWGRKETVQQELADRALGQELSRHLVKTFFQAVHFSYPAISPESFYLEWARAGQRSDRMTPAQEALCAVIEAWGSRYSDSPVVLGLEPERAQDAPRVIRSDGTFTPGTQARAYWGRARTTVCRALTDRARRLIDTNGILRQPSITGVQALTLFTQLNRETDSKDFGKDYWMESQMMHSAIVEQMRLLGLMWTSEGPIITDDEELPMSTTLLRMKQRRLFWTHLIGDALYSAAMGQLPKFDQEDVDTAGEWLHTVHEHLPPSSFKALSFFLMCYHRLGVLGRGVAIELSAPGKRKGSVDVWRFCATVRRLWHELESITADINTQTVELLESTGREDLFGFSPLNYLTNLRLCGPFLLLIVHNILRDQLEFRKELHSAHITTATDDNTPTASSTSSGSEREVELLDELSRQSVEMMLKACRAQVSMYKDVMPTGLIQTASIFMRMLIATSQLLAEVPTNEQGYPSNTPGGYGWTWEAKQKEVNCCLEGLYQVGWAWGDIGDVVDNVMVTMERMTPSPEELEKWRISHPQADDSLVQRVEEDAKSRDRALQTAMALWPPVSIPHLIEAAISRKSPAGMDSNIERLTRQTRGAASPDIVDYLTRRSGRENGVSRPSSVGQLPQGDGMTTYSDNDPKTSTAPPLHDPSETQLAKKFKSIPTLTAGNTDIIANGPNPLLSSSRRITDTYPYAQQQQQHDYVGSSSHGMFQFDPQITFDPIQGWLANQNGSSLENDLISQGSNTASGGINQYDGTMAQNVPDMGQPNEID
ncbi:hypothetical protein CI109_102154 [Kwoniella shandongensis]|uniref:Zn(2)-C6 fungal-type domain-containing protein n=1 Tax=Kwoniella shandongensis TaxID=1734106 RepID=A0AAJ8LEM0_9TREE